MLIKNNSGEVFFRLSFVFRLLVFKVGQLYFVNKLRPSPDVPRMSVTLVSVRGVMSLCINIMPREERRLQPEPSSQRGRGACLC